MRIGPSAEVSKAITDADIEAFAALTGDRNPVHRIALAGVAPAAAAFVMAALLARAAYGTARGWPATARGASFSGIAFGALTVFAAAGHHL